MRETEKIEKGTAEGFLALYNQHFGTDFETVEVSDAPDVRCADSHGNRLNIEVTATEDRPGDTKPSCSALRVAALRPYKPTWIALLAAKNP